MTTPVLERPKSRKRSARSLKREICNRLNIIDDTDSLRTILRVVIKMEPEMPEELVRRLEASDRSIAEGRTIPHEEVMERAKYSKQLPEYVRRDIEEGERQLDAGLGIPHEIAMEKLRRCLKEN